MKFGVRKAVRLQKPVESLRLRKLQLFHLPKNLMGIQAKQIIRLVFLYMMVLYKGMELGTTHLSMAALVMLLVVLSI